MASRAGPNGTQNIHSFLADKVGFEPFLVRDVRLVESEGLGVAYFSPDPGATT